jgi:hypothetical protein
MPLPSPNRDTCPAQLVLLEFIIGTIVGEECSSWSSSLWSLLHSLKNYRMDLYKIWYCGLKFNPREILMFVRMGHMRPSAGSGS